MEEGEGVELTEREETMEAVSYEGSGEAGEIEAVGTPTNGRKRYRGRGRSFGSPEAIEKDAVLGGLEERTEIEGLKVEFQQAYDETYDYLSRSISMSKHGVYLDKRFKVMLDIQRRWEVEMHRVLRWAKAAEKISSVEVSMRKMAGWDVERMVREKVEESMGFAIETLVAEAKKDLGVMFERLARKAEEGMSLADHLEEMRDKDIKGMETKYEAVISGYGSKMAALERQMAELKEVLEREGGAGPKSVGKMAAEATKLVQKAERLVQGVDKKVEEIKLKGASVNVEGVEKKMEELTRVVVERVAERVPEAMEVEEVGSWATVAKRRSGRRRGPQVVVEAPKEKRREDLVKCLNPKQGEVRVRGMRRQGKDYVLEVEAEEDIERLRVNEALKEEGFKVDGVPKLMRPRVAIFGVDKDISREELLGAVEVRNKELFQGWSDGERRDLFLPERTVGPQGRYTRTWVVRVDPKMHHRMVEAGKLFVGLYSCRVENYSEPERCFKCNGFGHIGKWCRLPVTCSHCGEGGHHVVGCAKRQQEDQIRCANCLRAGRPEELCKHSVFWKECPVREQARRSLERRTDYGS